MAAVSLLNQTDNWLRCYRDCISLWNEQKYHEILSKVDVISQNMLISVEIALETHRLHCLDQANNIFSSISLSPTSMPFKWAFSWLIALAFANVGEFQEAWIIACRISETYAYLPCEKRGLCIPFVFRTNSTDHLLGNPSSDLNWVPLVQSVFETAVESSNNSDSNCEVEIDCKWNGLVEMLSRLLRDGDVSSIAGRDLFAISRLLFDIQSMYYSQNLVNFECSLKSYRLWQNCLAKFDTALMRKAIPQLTLEWARLEFNRAVVHYRFGNWKVASNYAGQALRYSFDAADRIPDERQNYPFITPLCMYVIGCCYLRMNNASQALEYFSLLEGRNSGILYKGISEKAHYWIRLGECYMLNMKHRKQSSTISDHLNARKCAYASLFHALEILMEEKQSIFPDPHPILDNDMGEEQTRNSSQDRDCLRRSIATAYLHLSYLYREDGDYRNAFEMAENAFSHSSLSNLPSRLTALHFLIVNSIKLTKNPSLSSCVTSFSFSSLSSNASIQTYLKQICMEFKTFDVKAILLPEGLMRNIQKYQSFLSLLHNENNNNK